LPDRKPHVNQPTAEPERAGSAPNILTDEQIWRCTVLIADRDAEFPTGLSTADHQRLVEAVRARLADRLVQYVARAVAAQIHRDGRVGQEDHDHA
jgi:hypothetical protein